jgi:hypothetical protein
LNGLMAFPTYRIGHAITIIYSAINNRRFPRRLFYLFSYLL